MFLTPCDITMSSPSSPSSNNGKKSEILGCSKDSEDDNKDKEGELVALDYDIDTSKGERALKVRMNQFSLDNSPHVQIVDYIIGRLCSWEIKIG